MPQRERLLPLVAGAVTGPTAVLVLLAHVLRASALVAYRWDWSLELSGTQRSSS